MITDTQKEAFAVLVLSGFLFIAGALGGCRSPNPQPQVIDLTPGSGEDYMGIGND